MPIAVWFQITNSKILNSSILSIDGTLTGTISLDQSNEGILHIPQTPRLKPHQMQFNVILTIYKYIYSSLKKKINIFQWFKPQHDQVGSLIIVIMSYLFLFHMTLGTNQIVNYTCQHDQSCSQPNQNYHKTSLPQPAMEQ